MALTEKMEAFCLAFMETGNGAEAYRRSYNAEGSSQQVINNKASTLLGRDDIRVRLTELRAPLIKKAMITAEDLLWELEEARMLAMRSSNPQPAAAISATLGKAKLLGLDKQVVELTGKNGGAIVTRVERVVIDAPKE